MTVQVKDASGLALGGDGENRMNSGYSLKVEPTEAAGKWMLSQGEEAPSTPARFLSGTNDCVHF